MRPQNEDKHILPVLWNRKILIAEKSYSLEFLRMWGIFATFAHQIHATMRKNLLLHLLLLWVALFGVPLEAGGQGGTFCVLGEEQGLHGGQVLQMLQLADGRMVIVTDTHVNVYDGQQFRALPLAQSRAERIAGYEGFTHLYVDAEQRLWIKDWGKVRCVDLRTMRFVDNCLQLMGKDGVDDFFVDSEGGIWVVRDGRVSCGDGSVTLQYTSRATVQDLDVSGTRVFLFSSDGAVSLFDAADGRREAVCPAYGASRAPLYDLTSLVRRTGDGRFLQVRTHSRSVLQLFDPRERRWTELREGDYAFHTLTVGQGGTAYVTTSRGYFTMDLRTGEASALDSLRLPDGTHLATGLNTVCIDREGGVWLGTYRRGLLYASPLSGVFDTEEASMRLTPVLTSVAVNGRTLSAGSPEMAEDAPYASALHLRHSERRLTLTFSTMKYVHPRNVAFRYRVRERGESAWHTVSADSAGSGVDDRGILTLVLNDLPHGTHTLEVEATPATSAVWNGGVCRLLIHVAAPWWMSGWAWGAAFALAALVGIALSRIYAAHVRRETLRRNREELLLLRIQGLIEKCNQYESAMSVVLSDKDDASGKPDMNAAERDFLRRATTLVEEHLQDSDYSVEQLSRDLCMERTGLYRKLMSIMDKSPQTFIRSIRLEKAARMLSEQGVSVAQAAEATGFSSAGYFSKCFQKEFGHKPSEHAFST